MTTIQPALKTLAASFLTCKEIEGHSPRTISWYRDILARFCRYVDDTIPDATLQDIGLAVAREFVHYLQTGTERLHREEGLALRRKRRRKGASNVRVEPPASHRPNEQWAMDFVYDSTADRAALQGAGRSWMSTRGSAR